MNRIYALKNFGWWTNVEIIVTIELLFLFENGEFYWTRIPEAIAKVDGVSESVLKTIW